VKDKLTLVIESAGLEADLIDLDAEIDNSLTYRENKAHILELIQQLTPDAHIPTCADVRERELEALAHGVEALMEDWLRSWEARL